MADKLEIKKLYYDVVRKYGLPTFNNAVLQKKMKDLESEVGYDPARIYLQALLDFDWNKLEGDFKPTITNSLDIYSKRIKVLKFLQDHVGQAAYKAPSAEEQAADDAAHAEDWE